MRERLRPAYTDGELDEVYPAPHQHGRWHNHVVRVAVTAKFAQTCAGPVDRAADLSCGDGTVLRSLTAQERVFGDYAQGYPVTGPIEETIHQIDPVDVFVCCETLEHLDDPDLVLSAIRGKTGALVASTPIGAFDDTNPEHYWAWDRDAVEGMLRTAGFTVSAFCELDLRSLEDGAYCYGIWFCR